MGATRYGGHLASPFGTVLSNFLMQPAGAGVDVVVKGPLAVRGEIDVPVVRGYGGRHLEGVRWTARIAWRR